MTIIAIPAARAQNLYIWNGGSGTWNTSATNWLLGGVTPALWANPNNPPDIASFGGGPFTITVGTTVNVGALLFNTDGYTLSSGTLNLLAGGSITTPFASVSTGTVTIGSVLQGSLGFGKTGAGTLILTGTNTYTGGTTVTGGTLSVGTLADLGSASGIGTGGLTLNGGTFQYTGGVAAVNRGLTLAGAGTVDISPAAAALALSGAVSGTGPLTKAGAGTLYLLGNNSYSGGTVVTGGTLRVDTLADLGLNSGVGTGGITLDGGHLRYTGGTVSVNRGLTLAGAGEVSVSATGATLNLGGVLSGAGSLTKSGNETLVLSNAANSYTGGTTVNDGTLRAGVAGAFVVNTAYTVNGGTLALNNFNLTTSSLSGSGGAVDLGSGALTVNQSADTTYAGAITGTGSFTKQGGGTLTLTGANTYTGDTNVNGGTLRAGAAGALPNNTRYLVEGGTLDLNGNALTVSLLRTNNSSASNIIALGSGTLTVHQPGWASAYNGVITGSGGLVLTAGRVTLTSVNSYSGGTTAGSGGTTLDGTLRVTNLADLGSPSSVGTGEIILNNGELDYIGGTIAVNRGLTLAGPGYVTTGNGTLTLGGVVSGPGMLIVTGSLVLTGANTYAGGTSVRSTLQLGDGTTTGSIPGDVTVNSFGTMAFNPGTGGQTFGGAISGVGSVTKLGANALTLTGTNTYSGDTTVTGGTLQLGDGSTTGSITGNVTNNATLALNPGASGLTLGGNISGTGNFTKLGANTATLTGTNSYSGGTTISGGTLQIGNGGTTGSIIGDVINNGTLAFNRSNNLTFGGAISGSGNVTKLGAGTLTLSNAASSYTGVTTLAGGVVSVSTLSSAGVASPIGAANNDIDKLVFDGGTLRFASTSSTPTIIGRRFTVGPNGGTLQVADGDLRFGGDTIITPSGTGARTFTLNVAAGAFTEIRSDYFYEVGDTSTGVTKTGAGSAILSGFFLWTNTGPIQVNQGTLVFTGRSNNSGVSSAVTVASGATLTVNGDGTFNQFRIGSLSGSGTVQSNTDGSAHLITVGGNNGSTEFSGLLRDGNTANGSIAQVLKVGTGTWTLSGANTYTGSTQIDFGVLSVSSLADGGVASNIGASSNAAANLQLTGGTLRYTGAGTSTDRLFQLHGGTSGLDSSGTGALNFTNTGNVGFGGIGLRNLTLTGIGTGSLAPSLGGDGTVSLSKTGTGTWTLTGANTYTGATTISAGTLRVNGSLAAGSAVAVNSGGTLGGSGTVGGAVTVASGASIAPGNSVGTLTVGSLTVTSGSILAAEIGSAAANDSDKLVVTGAANPAVSSDVMTVNITGNVSGYITGLPVSYLLIDADPASTLTNANFALNTSGFTSDLAGSWSYTFSSGDLIATFTPVPEPGMALGFATAAIGFTRMVRRRKTRPHELLCCDF